jgi:hypothetical protein
MGTADALRVCDGLWCTGTPTSAGQSVIDQPGGLTVGAFSGTSSKQYFEGTNDQFGAIDRRPGASGGCNPSPFLQQRAIRGLSGKKP